MYATPPLGMLPPMVTLWNIQMVVLLSAMQRRSHGDDEPLQIMLSQTVWDVK